MTNKELQEIEIRINAINSAGEYLEYVAKEKQKNVKERLDYMTAILESLRMELKRIKWAEIPGEKVYVMTGPGQCRIYDFTTGKAQEVKLLTRKELEEYINHRAGATFF